ncbi:hypothetical protein H0A65_04670 [Alcaligenaceae bacterium]|nr:hypothetical protein [Alcaligenaceae bacterium]
MRTTTHKTPAKSLARWANMPRYDGQAFQFTSHYNNLDDLEQYHCCLQGAIDLIDLGLIPDDRPQALFPSSPEPGDPIIRIAHPTWWRTPNGSLLVWSDCYPEEVDRTLAHLHAAGWTTDVLPTDHAHWNPTICIPVIGSSDTADIMWLKACVLETVPQ